MKKMILSSVLLFVLLVETSCGGAFQNAASGGAVSEASGGAVSEVSGGAISDDKEEKEDSEREQVERESWDITFEDVLGNQQKLETGEIDKNDVGTKLNRTFVFSGCFVEGNHFYYVTDEIFRDKGEELGDITWDSEYDLESWGKHENKLYLVLQKEYELYVDKRPVKFITIDLNTWKTKTVDCSELYDSLFDIYVYHEKIYIHSYRSDKLDEIDMNGKKVRTISLGNDEDKKHRYFLQGIVDGKIYYLAWKGHQYVMKSKDLETGEEKKVLQYEQPAYDEKKLEYEYSDLHIAGNNLFIMDEFWVSDQKAEYAETEYEELGESRYILYQLPIKDGGKMKSVYKQRIVDCVFQDDEIYYIDDNHLLHRNNLKNGTDKIISKRKVERVYCTKDRLYVIKYKEREAYDEDAVEETVAFYMDFDGQHEKKLFEAW